MAEKKTIVVNGGANGGRLAPEPAATAGDELERARDVARRYRCEFIDLSDFQLHHNLFEKIPVHLMFRYNFVPLEETADGRLAIAIADPSQLMMIDEISLLLGKRIVTKVSTLKQISEILKKTEQSKRVLEDASEGFTLDVIREDEAGNDETISIDKLTTATGDMSPIIRLVDTTIFTALQRRASDIHIETRDDSVVIKFRIDGVRHFRTPRAPGRPFPGEVQRARHRLPRFDHAVDPWRRCRTPRARQRVDERKVPQAHTRRGGL